MIGLALGAFWDDAAMSFGGRPALLQGHPTISMDSEQITIHIRGHKVSYECIFFFTNHGPAKTVKIGFPDQGFGADETKYEDYLAGLDDEKKAKPFSSLKQFESWVDGKKALTTLEGTGKAESWHTKFVKFGQSESHQIRNTFWTETGVQLHVDGADSSIFGAKYVIHTGSSWKGPIRRAVVTFVFDDPVFRTIQPVSIAQQGAKDIYGVRDIRKRPKHAVFYSGFGKAQAEKNLLIFEANNLKPTAKDDLEVNFGYTKS